MAFPDDVLDAHAELFLGGTWTDVTGDLHAEDQITITRGRRDEASSVDPGRCQLTIDNTGGKYSPRNPRSPYYGILTRNTPLRIWVGPPALRVIGDASYADTPSDPSLDVAGDLDVRAEITPESWRPPAHMVIAARWDFDALSWLFRLLADGSLQIRWSTDGTDANSHWRTSTVPMPADKRRRAVRAVVDVDDAGNNTGTLYYADSMDGPWTQLGDPVTLSGTTTIANLPATVAVGADSTGNVGVADGGMTYAGRFHRLQVNPGGAAAAGIAFRGVASTTNGFTTSCTVPVPAGTVDGDVMLAVISEVTLDTITAPAGWTLLGSRDGGANLRSWLYQRIANAEPASYTWTFQAGGKNRGDIMTYTGADPVDPIAAWDGTGQSVNGTTFPAPAVAVPDGGWLVSVAVGRNTATGTATNWADSDAQDVERVDTGTASASGVDVSQAVVDSGRPLAAGSYGRTFTADQPQNQTVAWSVALRPAPASPAVVDVDFATAPAHATSFTDATGHTWTMRKNAEIIGSVRFAGEVSAWPARWDVSGNDVYVPVEAAGILRRLGQGAAALYSPLRRAVTTLADVLPVAYWPGEDGRDASIIASAVGGPAMEITGSAELASNEDFAASAPIPAMSGASFNGLVPAYEPTNETQVRFLLSIPASGPADGTQLISVTTDGTASRWQVIYRTAFGGSLQVRALDANRVDLIGDTGGVFGTDGVNGHPMRVHLELTQSGADVNWTVAVLEPGAPSAFVHRCTLAGRTVGMAKQVIVAPFGGLDKTAMGHWSVHPTITTVFDTGPALVGFTGELAGRRIQRLCAEEGIPLRPYIVNDEYDQTPAMGPQRVAPLLELLQQAADLDGGILIEDRERVGVRYLSGRTRYNMEG